jgi:hypothetical protein
LLAWQSDPLDNAQVDGVTYTPHLYASPLFVDDLQIQTPTGSMTTSVAFVATSNGWIYAVNAAPASFGSEPIAEGAILWRTSLSQPVMPDRTNDGVPFGVLSTPVIDLSARRIYVTSAEATHGWQAYALDLGSGALLPGWPVPIEGARVEALNRNVHPDGSRGNVTFGDVRIMSQRGALALSPSGDRLYVTFGSYLDGAVGWIVALDTRTPQIDASFSGQPDNVIPDPSDPGNLASAGIWGAGGPVVDSRGTVYATTGNSPETSRGSAGVWGNSALAWDSSLRLLAAYSPFNYCLLDRGDTDLSGSSPALLDTSGPAPHLIVFGGKQGNLYLLNRDHVDAPGIGRPPCDPAAPPSPGIDRSLLAPDPQPIYSPASRGPMNVFGPYSDGPTANKVNNAKMRTTVALYRDSSKVDYLYAAGNSRSLADLGRLAPPSIVRVRVDTASSSAPYLALDRANTEVVFKNPGSPVVSSNASRDPVVWVLDMNGARTDALVARPGYDPPRPILYAFDGVSLERLWQSDPLAPGGKYNRPVVAHGHVLVGTDRLYAFGN